MTFFSSLTAALTPLGLVWMVIILGLATFLHELAHYALARWQGVPVNSFSIGMGPVMWRRMWKGTEWRISALPLGGYVEIAGMTPVQGPDGKMQPPTTGYAALPTLGKIAVILAGPLMNLVLALALMTFGYSVHGTPDIQKDQVEIAEVVKGSRAEQLGLRQGDLITAIDGQDIPESKVIDGKTVDGWQLVQETLKTAGTHAFTVQRGTNTQEIKFAWQPSVNGQKQLLGIRYGPKINLVKLSVPAAASTAVKNTIEAVPQVLNAFGNLFKRFLTLDLSRDQSVSGPIGTAEIVSRAAALSPWALLEVAIMLNLSLAFFNLIPIPGLDGGRILLALIGAIKGSPLTFAQENAINFAGFAFVMMLMMFVIVRDVSRFF